MSAHLSAIAVCQLPIKRILIDVISNEFTTRDVDIDVRRLDVNRRGVLRVAEKMTSANKLPV
jgi:hypothetical protein